MKEEIIYQIFPDRFYNGDKQNDPENIKDWGDEVDRDSFFGGDLRGIIQKLDYLQWLGITAIYLNPIFSSRSNHKYDTDDYYKIDPAFGTLGDFKELVTLSHKKGIKVIIDGVFNHTGTNFFAFQDLLKNQEKSHYKTWYKIFRYPIKVQDPPTYAACGGVSFLPKLDTSNPEVQEYILNVIKYWERTGIDGIRLDVPFEIHHSLLDKIRESTHLYLLGEVWGHGGRYVPKNFNGVTNYLLRDLVKKAVVYQNIDACGFIDEWKVLEDIYKENIFYNVNLAGSHDTERIFTLCGGDEKKVNLFYAFLFFLPGIPLIYYGDEIGLTGENDPYCRRTMVWDEGKWNRKILDHMRYLIRLRKSYKALQCGKMVIRECSDRALSFERVYHDEIIRIIINFGFQPTEIDGVKLDALEYNVLQK